MDLRQLRYFVGIVDHGSLTRAAEVLHVAQPALSQHLRRLEEELGTKLVLRTTRGIVPTETGEHLVERARSLLAQVDMLRDEIRGVEAAPSGPVTIGVPTSLGMILSVPLALSVRRNFPQVRLRVVEGLSGHTLEWLRVGEVDLALVFGVEGIPGLSSIPVATERLHLVGPAGDTALQNLKAGREDGTVGFCALAELPLILPGRPHGVREEVEETARQKGVPLSVVLEMDALEHIRALVEAGAGYTVLSERVALASYGRLSIIPIADPVITRTIHLAHAADRPLSIAAATVHRQINALLQDLTIDGEWKSLE